MSSATARLYLFLPSGYTRIVFRVGDEDARKLGEGFSFFEARDLKNLETGQAICRVERSDFDFNLTIPLPDKLDEAAAAARRQEVITGSREKYGTARADVEAMLAKSRATPPSDEPPAPATKVPVAAMPVASEPVKVAEVPKAALSPPTIETKPPAILPQPTEPPKIAETPKTKEESAAKAHQETPKDLGRGGTLHKTIQERIQAEAHALGFFAGVESQLAEKSNQAADVVLRKGDLAIAVEIAVTTTTDHEFGNVRKCLAAGFTRVAVVSARSERLQAIAEAVNAGLGEAQRSRVSYHTPDEFIAELRTLAERVAAPVTETERTTRGYTVRRHGPKMSPEERKASEDAAIQVIAETMRKQS